LSRFRKQTHLPAELDEASAHLADSTAVVLPEIGDRLMVGDEAASRCARSASWWPSPRRRCGRRCLDADDHRVLDVDQIVKPVAELYALVRLGSPR